jgi:Protein of unknown function (DUF2971)
MPFFKFFRPNIYFEKAIRYNELYFSENIELNDPNDLKANYYFEDNVSFWENILSLKPSVSTWNLNSFIDVKDIDLAFAFNDLFKEVQFDSTNSSLRQEIDKQSKGLIEIFEKFIKSKTSLDMPSSPFKAASLKDKIDYCKLWLTALLMRAVDHKFYSVSFSKSALEPVMWAHYADGFKGCVIIYDDLSQKKIELRHNNLEPYGALYDFLEINYIDIEKKIPILECALGGQAKSQEAFLSKNSFWKYESEYRLFTTEKIPSERLAMMDVEKSNRDRILHHGTNSIVGIIFGPRCSRKYKEKVELTIMDNRFYHDKKPFYTFDTDLTHEGRLTVSSAAQVLCESQRQLKRVFDKQELQNLLFQLQIRSD